MFDVVIIGSGLSGVAAALGFTKKGIKPCLIDVGSSPGNEPPITENFYEFRKKTDSFSLMLGENLEGMYNIFHRDHPLPVKLISPRMQFVVRGSQNFSPTREENYRLVQSFASGGLANAWGAGVYRYDKTDLDGFPVSETELSPYYEELRQEIGISGSNDDLVKYFGREEHLQKSLALSPNAARLYEKYSRRRKKMNMEGVFLGRPRLAVLSEDLGERKACDYSNLEFWQPDLSYIYNPTQTLKKLIKKGQVLYKSGYLAKSWTREDKTLIVQAKDIRDNSMVQFRCRKLVLAAGAVNSAKLALASSRDFQSRLCLLDNPALQFPFIFPKRIGSRLETHAFGLTQLNVVLDLEGEQRPLQGSLLEITSPARAEFFQNFPLSARDNLAFIRNMLPAMMVLQLFFPSTPENGAGLKLSSDEKLELSGKDYSFNGQRIKSVLKTFRKLGAYSFPSLVVQVANGFGIHYAGTLPMVSSPDRSYTCGKNGELFGEPGVFVADASILPELPAKNCSYFVMANAMRTADFISTVLSSEA
ncbi:GMC oxidoreductase [Acidobacteriota bacterium]